MKWEDVDIDRGIVRVPITKNGQSLTLPLIDEAVQVLRVRRRITRDSSWVFPSRSNHQTYKSSGRWMDPKDAWDTFREHAGLPDFRFHDLRRSLGSWQAANGTPLLTIGRTLGHRSSVSTEVYARLNLEPIKQAVTLAAGQMFRAGNLTNATRKKLLGAGR
jgi:integrase